MAERTKLNKIRIKPYVPPTQRVGPAPRASEVLPPNPNLVQQGRRPASQAWLNSARPADIDGAVNPPQFYATLEEKNATRAAYGYPPIAPNAPPLILPTNDDSEVEIIGVHLAPPFVAHLQALPAAAAQAGLPDAPVDIVHQPADVLVSVTVTSEKSGKKGQKTIQEIKKTARVALSQSTTRAEFIRACLGIHGLEDKYHVGPENGPRFLMAWKGSSGGRKGASTIDSDRNFTEAMAAVWRKKADSREINAYFDKDILHVYLREQPTFADDEDGHGARAEGTQIPQVSQFAPKDRLHGELIELIQKSWKCTTHPGEHGNPGYCWRDPQTKEHYGLNNRRMAMWAASMAGWKSTIDKPPSEVLDGGSRDVQAVKPRGRNGPLPTSVATGSASNSQDSTSAAVNSVTLMVLSRMLDRLDGPAVPSTAVPPANVPAANALPANTPSANVQADVQSVDAPPPANSPRAVLPAVTLSASTGSAFSDVVSRIPDPGQELRACLEDFRAHRAIDLTASEDALANLEFTPDIIPDVALPRLCDVLGVVEGRALKFQTFCRGWYAELLRMQEDM